MECNIDKSAQVLKDFKDDPLMGTASIYMKYPHDQRDRIPSVAKNVSEKVAKEMVRNYNLYTNPQVDFDHVNVLEIKTVSSDQSCDNGPFKNECRWEYSGVATFETYVKCK